jgi:hypothetical protein
VRGPQSTPKWKSSQAGTSRTEATESEEIGAREALSPEDNTIEARPALSVSPQLSGEVSRDISPSPELDPPPSEDEADEDEEYESSIEGRGPEDMFADHEEEIPDELELSKLTQSSQRGDE